MTFGCFPGAGEVFPGDCAVFVLGRTGRRIRRMVLSAASGRPSLCAPDFLFFFSEAKQVTAGSHEYYAFFS